MTRKRECAGCGCWLHPMERAEGTCNDCLRCSGIIELRASATVAAQVAASAAAR